MIVFDIEDKLNQLFEEVYPYFTQGDVRLNKRGYKPLLGESLGFIVPDSNTRKQLKTKEYYKVDLDDFIEFATSELPKDSVLEHFQDDSLQIYSFLISDEAGLSTEYLGNQVQITPLDVVIARHQVGISITARIAYRDASSNNYIGFDNKRWEELVSLTYFPSNKSHPGEGKQLIEWDRYVVLCPTPKDNEWRFVVTDGPYSEYLKNEIEESTEDSTRFDYVSKLVNSSKQEVSKYTVQIEIARLFLCLPQYISFMYDLMSTERVKAKTSTSIKSKSKAKSKRSGLVYKTVKSINIIRPPSSSTSRIFKWSSPKRRHLVSGHWRMFSTENRSGKDQNGIPVIGKTWVKSHVRGKDKLALPDIEETNSQVIVHVKQTLGGARDEIKAQTKNLPESRIINIQEYTENKSNKPSREWMAKERSKLTAGLRYLILKRDDFTCKFCGGSPADTNRLSLEVDHIKPITDWGRTEVDNLQILCKDCNRGKGSKS